MNDDLWLGEELAGYRLETVIGRGGSGVVYRATHTRLGRVAAVKLLAPGLAADEQYRRRFEREVRIAAGLDHPNIVSIRDAGADHGVLYLVMGYVDGPSLVEQIASHGPAPLLRAVDLLEGVAAGLDAAHRAGLVHRAVKPADILLARDGSATVTRALLSDVGTAHHSTSASSAVTGAGRLPATLRYCAPEQIQGRRVDGRADQYALACVVVHCLTGHPPFPVDEASSLIYSHLVAAPPWVGEHEPAIPAAVDDVLARALAKEPDQRFPDCVAFVRALGAASRGGDRPAVAPAPVPPPTPTPLPRPARRRARGVVLVGLAAVLVVVLAVAGVAVMGSDGEALRPRRPQPDAATIPLPPGQELNGSLAVHPDGLRAYAVGDRAVSIVDLETNTVSDTIVLPVRAGGQIAVSPDGRRAYVTEPRSSLIAPTPGGPGVIVLDLERNVMVTRIATPGRSYGVAVSPDGDRAYVSVGSPSGSALGDVPRAVVTIDAATDTVVGSVEPPSFATSYAYDLAVSPDGSRVWAAAGDSLVALDTATNTIASTTAVDGAILRFELAPDGRRLHALVLGHSEASIATLDTRSASVATTTRLPRTSTAVKHDLASSLDGRYAYLAVTPPEQAFATTHELMRVDTVDATAVRLGQLPACDGDLVTTPDGDRLYAAGCGRSPRAAVVMTRIAA